MVLQCTSIAFKIPSREVDKSENKFWSLWNKDTKEFFLQFAFRPTDGQRNRGPPSFLPPPPRPSAPQNLPPPPMPPAGSQGMPPPPPNFNPVPPPPPKMN